MALRWTILFATLICCLGSAVAEDPVDAAILRSLGRPVFLKAPEGGFEIELKPGRDNPRFLHEGETLRCGHGGTAQIWLNKKWRTIGAKDGSFRIHIDRPLTSNQRAAVDALHRYGFLGASRGSAGPVWSPPQLGAVRVSTATIKWDRPLSHVSVSLSKEDSGRLWSTINPDNQTFQLALDQQARSSHASAAK
jgi:hypothetical protein